MKLRKITANYIYTAADRPLKNGILVLENSTIVDIISREDDVKEIAGLEFYGGMLVPAFIDMFVLPACPDFSARNFKKWMDTAILEFPKPQTNSIQRSINHLEAFGTRGALDIFPVEASRLPKEKSKVIFADKTISFDLPTQNTNTENPLLINRYTLTENMIIQPSDFDRCVVGTGSLQSHQRLSVFEELKHIQNQFPGISILELLKWATIQSANFLGLPQLGSFGIGKTPGINLITAIDYKELKLTDRSELKIVL